MEPKELRRLVETHQRMVFSIALRLTGDSGLAEEVAQDVFLQLSRSAEGLTDENHTRFWLCRVAVHRATDAIRRRSRRPEAQAEEWIPERHDTDVTAGNVHTMTGASTRIEELLFGLPEPMRVAIVLRYQEEMLPREIAEVLGQPVATVKSNLQRGLRLLRKKAAVTMKEYIR